VIADRRIADLVYAAERARWDGNRDVLLDIVAQLEEYADEESAERANVSAAASEHFLDGAWIEPKRTVRRLLVEEEGFEPALVDEAMHRLEEGE
jgi:hypothetical protein